MANDFFEWDRPNRERHAIWDGWAVRVESAPKSVFDFPGRRWFFSKSHLVYAFRRLWNRTSIDELDRASLASEGTWADLVHLGHSKEIKEAKLRVARSVAEERRKEEGNALKEKLLATEQKIDSKILDRENLYDDQFRDLRYRAAHGNPGDVVGDNSAEEARGIGLTALIIRQGIRMRNRLIAKYQAMSEAEIRELVGSRESLKLARAALKNRPLPDIRIESVLRPRLEELRDIAQAANAEILVVALPLDVLVSKDEWLKYGQPPIDMESTRSLLADLVRTAHELGMRALDATDALRAAEPNAFLDGDLHMTAKGQRALAINIAQVLREDRPIAKPSSALPIGRSLVPDYDEWVHTLEARVAGSSRLGCETIQVREWLRVTCPKRGKKHPIGIRLIQSSPDSLVLQTADGVDLIVPIVAREPTIADFSWKKEVYRLTASFQNHGTIKAEFAQVDESPFTLPVSTNAERLCECHQEIRKEREFSNNFLGYDLESRRLNCAHAFGSIRPPCYEQYKTVQQCESLLQCVQGDAIVVPSCPDGWALLGGTRQCFQLCDEQHPCPTSERCVSWLQTSVCSQIGKKSEE